MTAPKAPPRTETRGTMARTMALPGATAGPRPVALSTPPREVWVVADRNGVPWTAWSNEERAYGDAYVEDGYTLHRYVLAPATEREQATADCLCREIDPSDRPCIVCVSSDELGILRPADAMPATERTGFWVLRLGTKRGDGVYFRHGNGPHMQDQRTARKWESKEHALSGLSPTFFGGPWRAVALTRRVRRGP